MEHGGRGLTVEHTAAWTTECAIAEVPPWINMVGIVLTGGSILAFGTPEQQRTHLRGILEAEQVWCQLFSEPGAGSDLAALDHACRSATATDGSSPARRCGAPTGGWLTAASSWPAPTRMRRGTRASRSSSSTWSSPGIEVRPLRQMTGGSEFDEVFLDEVHLPDDALLGPLHGGWGVAMATLTNERGYIGSAGISLARRLDAIAALDGAEDAVTRDRLAELVARGRALQAMGRRQGPVASVAASLAKLGVTELMFDAAVLESDLAGADAMLAGGASARVLGAPGGRIAGGTTQVQKNIIGERLLGLPKEPKPR